MKKLLAGLFVFGALALATQAHAFTLNDALLQIKSLQEQVTQLQIKLGASVADPMTQCKVLSFSVSPTFITPGNPVTVKWETQNCAKVTLYGYNSSEQVVASGTRVSYPLVDTYYHIYALGSDDSIASSDTIGVLMSGFASLPTYSIYTKVGSNGSVSPTGATIYQGSKGTFTLNPSSGYTPVVTGCGGTLSGNTYTTSSITSNCTVSATFKPNTVTYPDPTPAPTPIYYSVYTSAGPNGSIYPNGASVLSGSKGAFTISPNSGYTPSVTGCGGTLSGNTYTTAAATSNCTVSATFKANEVAPTPITLTRVTLSGQTQVGQTLKVVLTPSNAKATYRWIKKGTDGIARTLKEYDTTGSYTITSSDLGSTILVIAKGTSGTVGGEDDTIREWSGVVTQAISTTPETYYSVYTSAGSNGSIYPEGASIKSGSGLKASFIVSPNSGYTPVVTGCGGTLSGNTYTTASLTSNCTVSATFKPNTSTTPSITVTSPNGGETYTAGKQITVEWKSQNIPTGTNVTMTIGHKPWVGTIGAFREVIINNDGAENFTIPSDWNGNYEVFIRTEFGDSGTIGDFSDNTFTINSPTSTTPSITVLSPNGGEVFTKGNVYRIKWNTQNISKVYLKLYKGGQIYHDKYELPETAINNGPVSAVDGYFDWLIPNSIPTGNDYTVKVATGDTGTLSDFSDKVFTIGITPTPIVVTDSCNVISNNFMWAGMGGDNVKALQTLLAKLGYMQTSQIDGSYGPITTEAVKAFQKANGIYVDGVVGATTIPVLNNLSCGKTSNNLSTLNTIPTATIPGQSAIDKGCLNNEIYSTVTGNKCVDNTVYQTTAPTTTGTATINRTLKRGTRGEDVRKLQEYLGITADGVFGSGTESSVIKWQVQNGLKADGLFGTQSRLTAGLQ